MTEITAGEVNTTAWWITLGAGLIIAIVVTALLHLLLRAVHQVERNVVTLWDTATTVAQNTATTWMLRETAHIMDALKLELERHDRLLSERDGK